VGANAATVTEASAVELPMERRVTTSLTFRELAEANVDFVFRTLCRMGLDDATADDATQQVFLIAAGKLESIEEGKERGFLYLTAKNVTAQHRQRAHRRGEIAFEEEELPEFTAEEPPPLEELLDRRRAREMLDKVLDSMPKKLREIFVLSELEELTAVEVAVGLEIPVGTATSRLRRARKTFDLILKRLRTRAAFPRSTP
jgi:RNA polymerase sigma factor (sigma-70 family)